MAGRGKSSCVFCGTVPRFLPVHLLGHIEEKPFHCQVCEKEFNSESARKVHDRIHSQDKHFSCELCQRRFHYKSNLTAHTKHVHLDVRPHPCPRPDCSYKAKTKGNLKQHLVFHTEEKNFECELCEKRFVTSVARQQHLKTHTGEKVFKCPNCRKEFVTSQTLQQHLRWQHGKEISFHCGVGKKVESMYTIYETSSEGKLFPCDICKRQFRQKGNLTSHTKQVHSNERPHPCPTQGCSHKAKRKSDLKTHLKYHSGEKKFECELCAKRFVQSSDLLKHLRYHTSEKASKCPICGKSFASWNGFRDHLRNQHLGEKVYICAECGKEFGYRSSLRRHNKKSCKED